MASKAGKFFLWLAVSVVLVVGFVLTCFTSIYFMSPEGKGTFRRAYRGADKIGGKYEDTRPPERINANYNLTFDDNGENPYFSGGGFNLPLKPGWMPRPPAAAGETKAPRFEYYIRSADGGAEIRLRHEKQLRGEEDNYYGQVEKQALFAHARAYAEGIAGKAAVEGRPPAYVAPSRLEMLGVDAGVDGCYRYTPEEQKRTGYEGEYFVFYNRGYRNVILLAVAFKPFDADAARQVAPELLASLTFN